MGIFVSISFFGPKRTSTNQNNGRGVVCRNESFGLVFWLDGFCFVSLRFPGFSKGFSYVFSISFMFKTVLRPSRRAGLY